MKFKLLLYCVIQSLVFEERFCWGFYSELDIPYGSNSASETSEISTINESTHNGDIIQSQDKNNNDRMENERILMNFYNRKSFPFDENMHDYDPLLYYSTKDTIPVNNGSDNETKYMTKLENSKSFSEMFTLVYGDIIGNSTRPGSDFNPWSIIWYIGSFVGLIVFFLVVSCAEWCCRRRRQRLSERHRRHSPRCTELHTCDARQETPPPSYHLFAPPSYDTIFVNEKEIAINNSEIFIVPVHLNNSQTTRN